MITHGLMYFQSGIRWKVVNVEDDGQNTSGELESLVVREGPITHFGLSLHHLGEGVNFTNISPTFYEQLFVQKCFSKL